MSFMVRAYVSTLIIAKKSAHKGINIKKNKNFHKNGCVNSDQ